MQILGLKYSKNFYSLSLFGNNQFLGQDLNFGNNTIVRQELQKVGFIFLNKKTNNSLAVNYYYGNSFANFDMNSIDLGFSSDADTIVFALKGSIETDNGVNRQNGWGAGIDLSFALPIKNHHLKIENLGIIKWNSSFKTTQVDTSGIYDGLDIFTNVVNNPISSDRISDSFDLKSTTGSSVKLLPTRIALSRAYLLNGEKIFEPFYGVEYYLNSTQIPFIHAGMGWKTNTWLNILTSVTYGGFGKLNTGLGIYIHF